MYDNKIVVYLRPITNLPIFEDCCASQAATVGVDLTDPSNWVDLAAYGPLALCWDILSDRHDIVVADRLIKLEGVNDGYIPFDHATGKLRAILSLLKFSQDKLYRRQHFETSLRPQLVSDQDFSITLADRDQNKQIIVDDLSTHYDTSHIGKHK